MNTHHRQSGFTLLEVMVVLVVLGIVGGTIYTVLFTNWSAYDDQIVRANLLQEANEIVELITDDARAADRFVVGGGTNLKSLSIVDVNNVTIATYSLTQGAGGNTTLNVVKPGYISPKLLSTQVNFANTTFLVSPGDSVSLNIVLGMRQGNLQRNVDLITSTQIFPRN